MNGCEGEWNRAAFVGVRGFNPRGKWLNFYEVETHLVRSVILNACVLRCFVSVTAYFFIRELRCTDASVEI